MKKSTLVIGLLLLVLVVLHQDTWNWHKDTLVFGFMPIGLFYHAVYSVAAATFWGVVMLAAWPREVEKWAEGGGDPQ